MDEDEEMSHCQRENCFARYSKCIASKALNQFLEQESSERNRPFSAPNHVSSWE